MGLPNINGELPVAITILDGQTPVRLKQINMQQLTVGESMQVQSKLKEGQWVGLGELAAMVHLVDESGKSYPLTYEALESSSRQNLGYLDGLRTQLDAKEQAESLN